MTASESPADTETEPATPYVLALHDEHTQYARSLYPGRVIAVEDELAKLGWAVSNGELVRPPAAPEKADKPVRAPRERAVTGLPETAVDKG